jgi:hypothetical protein
MSDMVRKWHFNRPSSFGSKFRRWSRNPIGAAIRFIEFSYFKVPLVSLLKSHDHLREVSHLNQDLEGFPNDLILRDNFMHLENNLILLKSGHVLFIKLSYQSFLSGLHAKEIRELQNDSISGNFLNAIPLPKQHYYYHFVVEYLPELLRLIASRNKSYVLSLDDQPKFVKEYLDLLGIPVRYVSHPKVQVKDSAVPIQLDGTDFDLILNSKHLDLSFPTSLSPNKILILRRGLARDDIQLNQTLLKIFQANGFTEVILDDMPIVSQIELFRNVHRVAAIHGGALTNLIYCRKGVEVLEIFNEIYRNFDYERISKLKELSYIGLGAEKIHEIQSWASDLS